MHCQQISLLCFFVSVAIACVSKDEEVDVDLSPAATSADRCPKVADVTGGMPQILNHLVRKVCTGMVFTLTGLGRKARGECGKSSLQSHCSVSKNSSTKFECSVTARHLNFDCASHTAPLSAAEAKLVNDHYINEVDMEVVVELQEEAIIRVTDVASLKAETSAMRGIPGLSESVLQKAVFTGLKAAAGRISCSLI
ncbi:hypothetical protein TSMEX_002907 [Taenia solium]|eukprot:TsM_000179800 transcript=TsM_000179800 gene=TsM_000179800